MKKNNNYFKYIIFIIITFIAFMNIGYAQVKVDLNPNSGCQVISDELKEWLQWILDVIRVGGIILTVVLGITDYVKATFASDDTGMKKANGNFSKRLICLLLLFLAPTIISFLIDLINLSFSSSDPACGIK